MTRELMPDMIDALLGIKLSISVATRPTFSTSTENHATYG